MILQINKYYRPDIGGVETIVAQYTSALKDREPVTVLAIKKHFSFRSDKTSEGQANIIRCASLGSYLSMPISFIFPILLFFNLKQARIVHLHEPFPLASILLCMLPPPKRLFISWHSEIVKQRWLLPIVGHFQKRLLSRAEKIIVTSQSFAENSSSLAEFRDKITVIPPWVDSRHGLLLTKKIAPSLPKYYVLFLGRMSYYKGLHVLIDAIPNLPASIPFVLAGEGNALSKLKGKLEKLRANVTIIPRSLESLEKAYLLQNCKFLVFPSTHESETFGIIQLEAMRCGKPVINTNLSTGVPFASLHDVSGLTVQPGDSVALGKAILRLYQNQKEYERLAKGAMHRSVTIFSRERISMLMKKSFFD